ncbi:hypothetical protein GSI_10161 [Ganoderma sinense ZZ0214-1]|uniref:Fungal-type protein kinase domain-containing protein n=1 Tax=Ganoderma sinense ZZ0214-1 TaxID=1077348 RepID=A0A2G8RZT0_9APHY|nr:hypothetical protein GSI_10161 [Ganoderma sinense ZZ0214-1]
MALGSNVDLEETPRSLHKAGSAAAGSVGYVDLTQYRAKCAEDMEGRSVLADCIWEFLDELLPYPAGDDLPSRPKPDPSDVDQTGQKIDGAIFHSNEAPTDGRPWWFLQIIPVEFKSRKHGNCGDPYTDIGDGDSPDSDADTRREARGQVTTYAERIYYMQHRWGLFMLLIIGRRFRILFWDRGGTIVTKSIDYYEEPDALCEFLWRVSDHLPDEKLGIDPTATRLQPDDFDSIRMDLASLYVRAEFAETIKDDSYPRYTLRVQDEKGSRSFLVGNLKPVYAASGMGGRGTRGYIAYEQATKRFFWLKDAWRAAYEHVSSEGDILQQLRDVAGITNVPTLVCHGDVGHQATVTADWWERKHPKVTADSTPAASRPTPARDSVISRMKPKHDGKTSRKRADTVERDDSNCGANNADQSTPPPTFRADCPIRRLVHYRMVVAEVCMKLDKFTNGRQLVSVVLDCLKTHKLAATHPIVGVLHRDITGNNILIYPKVVTQEDGSRRLEWKGILSDWEISKPVAADSRPRQPERTGTWQFVSVNLLSNELARVSIPDELESMFHVLVYYALRYLQSNLSDHQVAKLLDEFFDCFTDEDGAISCGNLKASTLRTHGELKVIQGRFGSVRVLFRSPMDHIITTLLQWFKARYAVLDYNVWVEENGGLLLGSLPGASEMGHTAETPPPPSRNAVSRGGDLVDDEDGDVNDDVLYQDLVAKDPPTDDEIALEKRIQGHDDMITFLTPLALPSSRWQSRDKAPSDRVPANYVSPYPIMPNGTWNPDRFLQIETAKQPASVGVFANLMTFCKLSRTIEASSPAAGIRSCIGWRFSVIEMQAFLGELLETFQFDLPKEKVEIQCAPAGVGMVPIVRGKPELGAALPLRISLVQ